MRRNTLRFVGLGVATVVASAMPGCLAKFDKDYPLGERDASVSCRTNNDCAGDEVCDSDSGECVECVRSSQCEAGEQCSNGRCVSDGAAGSGGGAAGSVGSGGSTAGGTGGDGTGGSGGLTPKDTGESCQAAQECESDNCVNGLCCAAGAVCCAEDSHCIGEAEHLACNIADSECYDRCGPDGQDNNDRCAAGYHCDANTCVENIVLGQCDEDSDCASGSCQDNSCCQHAGLCCGADQDCPDMFDGCATDLSQTCVFSLFTVPDTGQTDCHDVSNDPVDCATIAEGLDYHGQDGHYTGPPRSYLDLGDGTVQDQTTGLVWAQTPSDGVSYDNADGYCYDLTLAGRTWRLPKRYELHTLVDYDPTETVGIAPVFDVPADAQLFWTGTELAGSESSTAWVIDFRAGTIIRTGKDNTSPRVLCVAEGGAP